MYGTNSRAEHLTDCLLGGKAACQALRCAPAIRLLRERIYSVKERLSPALDCPCNAWDLDGVDPGMGDRAEGPAAAQFLENVSPYSRSGAVVRCLLPKITVPRERARGRITVGSS